VATRRNLRIQKVEGFQHVQLEGTPQKCRRFHAISTALAGPSLDAPPKPIYEVLPGPVPRSSSKLGSSVQCAS